MKFAARNLAGFAARPDEKIAAVLLYGEDAMRVALKRQDLLKTYLGPAAEEEMRLTRLAAADLRKDPAALTDAAKAQGFFPGVRAVLAEDAGDNAVAAAEALLQQWQPGDGLAIFTAGRLTPRGKLRKLFEGADNALCVPIYDDPPSRQEIEAELKFAGVRDLGGDAQRDLAALAALLDPGDFRQFVEKLALYTRDNTGPITVEDVAAVAPATTEAELDEVIHAVADARADQIVTGVRKLEGQGEAPVRLCIVATQHFRRLYEASADPGGPAAGLGKLRPPVFGPNRDRMARQLRDWGPARLSQALHLLTETDLALRSSQRVPPMAMLERTLIRVARLKGH